MSPELTACEGALGSELRIGITFPLPAAEANTCGHVFAELLKNLDLSSFATDHSLSRGHNHLQARFYNGGPIGSLLPTRRTADTP
jgi:hypothetical protein